jgi:hypothetical protein
MSDKFEFDLSKPIVPIEAPLEPATALALKPPASDQERLASIRQKTIALSKETSVSTGFIKHASYYQDFAGPETSHWDFNHLTFLLNFLQDPKFGNLYHCLDEGHFSAIDANWTRVRATQWKFSQGAVPPASVSLVELKAAFAARIKELGISEILLAEWMVIPLGIADDQAFYRLSFSEKMQTFRGEPL